TSRIRLILHLQLERVLISTAIWRTDPAKKMTCFGAPSPTAASPSGNRGIMTRVLVKVNRTATL
ncbi:hypothetical protein LTR92_011660, partial [Exophiala xenobiotica]